MKKESFPFQKLAFLYLSPIGIFSRTGSTFPISRKNIQPALIQWKVVGTNHEGTEPPVLAHILGQEVKGALHLLAVLGQDVGQCAAPVHAETAWRTHHRAEDVLRRLEHKIRQYKVFFSITQSQFMKKLWH